MKRRGVIKVNRKLYFLAALILTALLLTWGYNAARRLFFPLGYRELVYKYANEYGLDPFLIFAIIKAESGFDPGAKSSKGARGLMQVTEKTGSWAAQQLGIKDFDADRLYEPEVNIMLGCWYVRWLTDEFGDPDLVIAAYNSGNGKVREWLKDKSLSSSGYTLDRIPFKETEQFVKRVKKYRDIYRMIWDKNK